MPFDYYTPSPIPAVHPPLVPSALPIGWPAPSTGGGLMTSGEAKANGGCEDDRRSSGKQNTVPTNVDPRAAAQHRVAPDYGPCGSMTARGYLSLTPFPYVAASLQSPHSTHN